ncbi:MarR family winged helix-turn-helix transcriptional regulator [Nocardia miyunensis]|uniref:MarR family winged helix-turn-helix transcriptional regulator n=1 Tax=Nocardia miyunensis TaxID=282684 RepID=UPI000ACA8582|nr:MarR family transcriptional regulator [Nocardia miyunensis]
MDEASADGADVTSNVSAEQRRRLTTLVPMVSAYLRRARYDMPPVIREVFEQAGLGARHGAVLSFVLSSGPASVSEVARQLGLGLTNASQLSGELTRAGLLRRRNDPADHRRTLLSAAPEYRAAFEEFLARRSAGLFRAMDRLTPEERHGFIAGLQAWVDEIAAGTEEDRSVPAERKD